MADRRTDDPGCLAALSPEDPPQGLEAVVDALCRSNGGGRTALHWNPCHTPMPSRDSVIVIVQQL